MMTQYPFNKAAVVDILNRILEAELIGVIRYTHYSFRIFGPDRIPIITWLREQASESTLHAHEAGELITHLGEHPTLHIDQPIETGQYDTMTILKECMAHEEQAINLYRELLEEVKDKSIMIEEFARKMIAEEELHMGEVGKMLGGPDVLNNLEVV